jgi:hypothetical protein
MQRFVYAVCFAIVDGKLVGSVNRGDIIKGRRDDLQPYAAEVNMADNDTGSPRTSRAAVAPTVIAPRLTVKCETRDENTPI